MRVDNIGVHRTHCCKTHGCKYRDDDCPVVLGNVIQDYDCEDDSPDSPCFPTPIIRIDIKEVVSKIYKDFCKETKRSGGVLVTSSITEWHNYLSEKLEEMYEYTRKEKTGVIK